MSSDNASPEPLDIKNTGPSGPDYAAGIEDPVLIMPGSMPPPNSGDYPTNTITDHRYGAHIDTGLYDQDFQNVARTTYIIHESELEHTAPNSGEGIHARQYHGRELESTSIGTTTVIHDFPAVRREEPETHVLAVENERQSEEDPKNIQRQAPYENTYGRGEDLGERVHHERELEVQSCPEAVSLSDSLPCDYEPQPSEPMRGCDLQRERDLRYGREMAMAAEGERITRERIDTRIGSVHGIFGRGRHRDARIVGRDTDATDFGNKTEGKIDAHRDVLASSGSEYDKLIGTTKGRERLAKEQDAKLNSVLGSQAAAGDEATRYHSRTGATTTPAQCNTSPQITTPGVPLLDAETRSATVGTGTAHDRSTKATKPRQEAEKGKRKSHHKDKPTMVDKIVGNAEVVWGKATHNAALKAKGDERAAGFSRN